MRSSRYKRRSAHIPVAMHHYGWTIGNGWYPMQNEHYLGELFYSLKNDELWQTIYRKAWQFTNDYDKENYIFSNMKYVRIRRSIKYEMRK